MGIEPTLSAWEAEVLPLNYTRTGEESMPRHRALATHAGDGLGASSRWLRDRQLQSPVQPACLAAIHLQPAGMGFGDGGGDQQAKA